MRRRVHLVEFAEDEEDDDDQVNLDKSPPPPPPSSGSPLGGKSKSKALVLYTPKKKRRTEVQMLQEDWRKLHFFKRIRYEPMLDSYGSQREGNERRSRRIQQRNLITAS